MGKTLYISSNRHETNLRITGLSFKAVSDADHLRHGLCRSEVGFYIDNQFKLNGRTAQIATDKLIPLLKELHECIPFTKITIHGRYEMTGEQLLTEVLKP